MSGSNDLNVRVAPALNKRMNVKMQEISVCDGWLLVVFKNSPVRPKMVLIKECTMGDSRFSIELARVKDCIHPYFYWYIAMVLYCCTTSAGGEST